MLGFLERLPKLLNVTRVRRAITEVERRTSGQIRVSVSPFFWGNAQRAAERAFTRLGMQCTKNRNAVLFFIVPSRRSFVVLGDVGIHERLGNEGWDRIVAQMTPYFRTRDYTNGVLAGIDVAATELAKYFPPDESAKDDELPDFVDVAKR
jgi:uncharacterized membrane protein